MEDREYLQKYYDSLYDVLLSNKQFPKNQNSIFLKYVTYTKNNAETYLTESCVRDIEIPSGILETLRVKKFIRDSSREVGNSHITAHGVWEIEKKKLIEEEILVEYFDSKQFSFSARTPTIKDQDKLRLFTMLATRAFSIDSPLRIQTESEKNNWKGKCDECYAFLYENKIISKPLEGKGGIYGGAASEKPIVNLFRHSEDMRTLTKGIWCSDNTTVSPSGGKGLTYYLDVSKGEELDKTKLAQIIKIIFGNKLNSENEYTIKEFCNDIAFDCVGLFSSKHIFSSPKYEDDVSEAVFQARLELT